MKRKVKRPFDNEQFRKGYVAGIFAAEKELNTKLLHFAEKAHKIMSEGTFPDYGVKINFKDSHNTIATNLDMKTEEKAKKYDEAIEWMRKVYPTLTGADKEDAEHYFPELKEEESEDKRIRKDLIKYLESDRDCQPCQDVSFYDSSIAWLEKQKENLKSADSISSDCTSDAKCEDQHNEEGDFVFELRQIISSHRYSDIYGEYTNDEEGMASEILELCKCELEKQKEQKPAEFDEYKIIKKHITEDSLSSEVNKRLTECGWYVTDEKPEEWSKEDEYRRKDAIYFLETARKHYADTSEIELTIDWLKSLKPQPKQDWMKEQKNKSM